MLPTVPVRRPALLAGTLLPALLLGAACAGAQQADARVRKDADAGASAARAPAPANPLKLAPRPTTAAITAADLMTRLYIFADDSMMGREAGTEGNVKGNAYIERELRRLGLRPAGEDGGYLQTVPLVRRAWDRTATLVAGSDTLRFGRDFAPIAQGVPRSIDGATAVYGGAATAAGALTAEQVRGKVVVLSVAGMQALRGLDLSGSALGQAAGVVLATPGELPPQMLGFLTRAQLSLDSAAFAAAGGAAPAPTAPLVLLATARAAGALLGAAPEGLAAGTTGRTVAGTVAFRTERAPATNVVALIPGSDPVLRGTYVALGAHNDHDGVGARAVDHDSLKARNTAARAAHVALDPEGDEVLTGEQRAELQRRTAAIRVNVDSLRALRPARRDSIFNGADDDGSGSMALLEIAEQVAAMPTKPKRSLLFVWHTAEEKGLLGSRWYADHPTVPRDSIVAQLNIDMIGRGGAADIATGGGDYVGIVGSRRLSTQLGDLAASLARASGVRLDYALDANGHPENIYCRSDHYSYARWGIPIAFFFTGLHGDYHQVTDEPQYIDYPHYARITSYVRDLAVRVADLPQRPVVDGPKPDPRGGCRQ